MADFDDLVTQSFPSTKSSKKSLRSCSVCHERKVRCDRSLPCSNCRRTGACCSYPLLESKRKRNVVRTPVAAVFSRIERLEKAVLDLSKQVSERCTRETSEGSTWSSVGGVLLGEADNGAFYSDEAFATIIAQTDESNPSGCRSSSGVHESLGACPQPSVLDIADTADLSLSPWQSLQLWQIYLRRVDPLVKVLHIPTCRSEIETAIQHRQLGDPSTDLLVSAIYCAATISLDPQHLFILFGREKRLVLDSLQKAFEKGIGRSNILFQPCVRSLQALAIYLTGWRAYDSGRSIWTLTGLAIRLAHSLGLHRDGSELGLSPFETEVRRRLWWHLAVLEFRAAEDHGLSPSTATVDCNTEFPTNVDDAGLPPEMTVFAADQSEWTESTFSIIRIEAMAALLKDLRNGDLPLLTRSKQVKEFTGRYSRICMTPGLDSTISKAASTMISLGAMKADFLLRLRDANGQFLGNGDPGSTDLLNRAEALLKDYLQIHQDESLHKYLWIFRVYGQWYALGLVLKYLYVNPTDLRGESLWKLVNDCFSFLLEDRSLQNKGQVWLSIALLREKAWQRFLASGCSVLQSEVTQSQSGGFTDDLASSGFDELGEGVYDFASEDFMNRLS